MSGELVQGLQANLLSPPVLFFALGMLAAVLRSDLKFPEALYVSLTIYLLCAIGFKGGVAMAEAGLAKVWLPTVAAMTLGALIPMWTYPVLRFAGKLPAVDAAAIAGHYGSVSAVTFIAATNFLKELALPFEGYATAFLAAMEAPAIIVGIVLGKMALRRQGAATGGGLGPVLHEALLGRSVFLLVGTLLAGFLCGKRGMEAVAGFLVTPFQGVLALFLLELGTVAGRRLGDLRKVGAFLVAFGIVMPLLHGTLGVLLGQAVGLSLGGTTLVAVLAASASYIAAPAAMRLSLPDANPTLYLTAALVITFPFNVTVGIPIYYAIAKWWLEETRMPAHAMKLVTIICEALARGAVTRLLREVGGHGYTLFEVEGVGAKGERTAEIAEFGNIQVEMIVPAAVCERLMERLEMEFFPKYAMVAYEADVRVRRPGKF